MSGPSRAWRRQAAGLRLVRAVQAWARCPELEQLQAEARQARRGLWAAPEPMDPRQWRRNRTKEVMR